VVQKNAANAEEVAATSEELNSQSINMKELVSYFNIGDQSHSHTSVAKKKSSYATSAESRKEVKAPKQFKQKETHKTNGVHINLGGGDSHDNEYERF
jgi:methyl-accepting chemotaxis protein